MTAERVATSIRAVVTGDYRECVEKLSEIFRFAGGTKKAADILEHYASTSGAGYSTTMQMCTLFL